MYLVLSLQPSITHAALYVPKRNLKQVTCMHRVELTICNYNQADI